MRIMNKDRDIFADMMNEGKTEVYAYGNIYKVYVVGSTYSGVDTGLIVSTYNIVKMDGRGCTENTYAVLETPIAERYGGIAFIAGRWAHIDRQDTNTSRVWE